MTYILFRRDTTGHCALEAAHIAGHEHVAALLIEEIQRHNDSLNEAHQRLIEACIEGNSETVDEIFSKHAKRKSDIDVLVNGKGHGKTALFM